MGSWSSWVSAGSKHVNSFGSYSRFYLDTTYRYKVDGTTVSYEVKLTARYYNTTGTGGNGTYDDAIDVRLVFNGSDKGWVQVAAAKKWYHGDTASHTFTGLTVTAGASAGTVPITCYENNHSNHSRFDNPSVSYNITKPAAEVVTISFNANGGSGGPGNVSKTIGTALTISYNIPMKTSTTISGYTITFNDSIGTPDYLTYSTAGATTYEFSHWNTASNGTGVRYMPGDSYTGNSAATLYAIYNSHTNTSGRVPLPNSKSTTHILLGWTRNQSSGVLVDNLYIPTQNETLYAVWKERTSKVKYKNSSNWLPGVAKIKDGSSWVPDWQEETDWTSSSFSVEGTTYKMPPDCSWGYWLRSSYNTDWYYADLINGSWRIVVEEDFGGSAFVLANVSFDTVEELWESNILSGSTYTIQKIYYYTRLEYIESTGTQYINTGYTHNTSATHYELDCVVTSLPNQYQTFFGARSAHDSTDAFYIGSSTAAAPSGHTYGCIGGTKMDPIGWTPTIGERYFIHYHPVSGLTINSAFNYPIPSGANVTYSYPDTIFALNQAGSVAEKMCLRVYSFKIYENNALVRNLIPCYRDTSVGMYATVNKVFYDNGGSGTFTKGPELNW